MSSCATALYYYETENTTESRLSFRRSVDPDQELKYPRMDFRAVEEIFGIRPQGPSLQKLGDVVTKVRGSICKKTAPKH